MQRLHISSSAVVVRLASLFTAVIIVLATLLVVALHPEQWKEIVGFTTPTIMALLVLGRLESYHAAVNSKMDALLSLTAKASRAEGVKKARSGRPRRPREALR